MRLPKFEKKEKWFFKRYLDVLSGDSIFILQSLTTSKMRKCQTIKLSQLHRAKTCWTENLRVFSRVHKSPPPFFSKILEKPSIVQKEIIPNINGLGFSLR